ncbi:MAG: hypothetical protein BSOLF_1379 [Candidatus Carbobacillus altaicus]|uniref:Uncharacterized protein n=1 Tax=Candidatus Carbonibacillus altaicus TaxID=2163959 RepID=A0A2R6Y4A1_9BACL|nr:MAG: hypothetical protein BSOLF_1379 [Candidatus Carbobacillus altaicus]
MIVLSVEDKFVAHYRKRSILIFFLKTKNSYGYKIIVLNEKYIIQTIEET